MLSPVLISSTGLKINAARNKDRVKSSTVSSTVASIGKSNNSLGTVLSYFPHVSYFFPNRQASVAAVQIFFIKQMRHRNS
jgi:hypothetical protein